MDCVHAPSVRCLRVYVLLDCKIQLLFQFPLLLDILNQCDNLIFRHFLLSLCLLLCCSSCLQTSVATQALIPSFPPFLLLLFLSGVHCHLLLPPSLPTTSVSPWLFLTPSFFWSVSPFPHPLSCALHSLSLCPPSSLRIRDHAHVELQPLVDKSMCQ